jgi:hypothetical protein
LVTALSRLLTPLKFASSEGDAPDTGDALALGAAEASGAAVVDPRGVRRTPWLCPEAVAEPPGAAAVPGAASDVVGAAVVPTGEIVPVVALAYLTADRAARAPEAKISPMATIHPSARDKRTRLDTAHLPPQWSRRADPMSALTRGATANRPRRRPHPKGRRNLNL